MIIDDKVRYQYENRMNTGVLLLLNCPKFMTFGIDYSGWTIGEKFMGVKFIPDGVHFVYYSLKDEDYAMKQGFFINITKENDKLVYVRKWNSDLQDFTQLKEEETKNFTIGVNNLDFDAYLGVYPNDQNDNWRDLTRYIDVKVLDKLEPISKKYVTTSQEYEGDNTENSNTINTNSSEVKGNIYYTTIPKKKFVHKVEPDVLTKSNIDKSNILNDLLKNEYSNNHSLLLGEFQYSFITFMLGEVYESFEQWKSLIILVLSCQELIVKEERFYCNYFEVLYHQLRQLPKDFFIDEISSNNFMCKIFENFIIFVKTNTGNVDVIPNSIAKRGKLFEMFLKEFFGHEIKDENTKIIEKFINNNFYPNDLEDDEMPVIVDEKEIEEIMNYNLKENENTVDSNTNNINDMDITY